MKHLLILTITCIILLVNCKTNSDFVKVSERIEQNTKRQLKATSNKGKTLFYAARIAVFKKIKFLKKLSKSDTLYIIESYDSESFLVRGTIWDKRNSVSYEYRKLSKGDELNFLNNSPFFKRQISLVKNWNAEQIKAEEISKTNLKSQNKLLAARCYFKRGLINVDQIIFQDFFDPKQDALR